MSEQTRQRILLVTRNLPPLLGGMERLNWHIAEQLAMDSDIRIIGPAGCAGLVPPNIPVQEVSLNPLPRFLAGAMWNAVKVARQWRPDLVFAGSGLTAPLAWLAARISGAKAAVYLHGLDIGVRHAVYRLFWISAIRHADVVIANSRATRDLAVNAGVDPGRIRVVHPGTDIPSKAIESHAEAEVRRRFHLGNGPVLLSVGRLTERKGMREFVADVLPGVAAAFPTVKLLIVGEAPTQSLLAKTQSRESIEAIAVDRGVADSIHFAGRITDRTLLNDIYRTAAVHVFPVQQIDGDPEGFGMVAIEAAAHGLPTVAYATGGIVDAVADGESGRLVAAGDSKAMADAVIDVLSSEREMSENCRRFARRFAWPHFGSALRSALAVGRG